MLSTSTLVPSKYQKVKEIMTLKDHKRYKTIIYAVKSLKAQKVCSIIIQKIKENQEEQKKPVLRIKA
jgi:hypothetical protein